MIDNGQRKLQNWNYEATTSRTRSSDEEFHLERLIQPRDAFLKDKGKQVLE